MKFLGIYKYFLRMRTVKRINKALSISLYDWQIRYIFNDGDYYNEFEYGRYNGKTLANVLKFLLSGNEVVTIDRRTMKFYEQWAYKFAREDNGSEGRKRIFVQEVLRIYNKLKSAKDLKIRKLNLVGFR